jgi:hypothetical protein
MTENKVSINLSTEKRLGPGVNKNIIEPNKIPEDLQYNGNDLKYDKSRKQFYIGKNLDEIQEK